MCCVHWIELKESWNNELRTQLRWYLIGFELLVQLMYNCTPYMHNAIDFFFIFGLLTSVYMRNKYSMNFGNQRTWFWWFSNFYSINRCNLHVDSNKSEHFTANHHSHSIPIIYSCGYCQYSVSIVRANFWVSCGFCVHTQENTFKLKIAMKIPLFLRVLIIFLFLNF